jgi:hypothetical protein
VPAGMHVTEGFAICKLHQCHVNQAAVSDPLWRPAPVMPAHCLGYRVLGGALAAASLWCVQASLLQGCGNSGGCTGWCTCWRNGWLGTAALTL